MNFLTSYLRYAGHSEVPPLYHLWCGLAALATVAADRVWVEKHPGDKLVPNLYVFLLGPSGIGKGQAIGTAFRLLQRVPAVRTLRGKITAAALCDLLAAKPTTNGNETMHRQQRDGKLLLVTPELALSVGRGPLADDLVKLLTELYTGGDYEFHEQTRTHGLRTFRGHCVSWLAGTTREWLRDCITKDAVEGGFFARVAAVAARYDLERRIASPTVPDDWRTLGDDLVGHLDRITSLGGALRLDPRARQLVDDWYLTRPSPDDEALIPTWKREHDLVLKLAALASLADRPDAGCIEAPHVIAAQRWAQTVTSAVPALVEYVALTRETDGLRAVREIIRQAGVIQHVALARVVARSGMTADVLGRFVRTLREGGYVSRDVRGRGAVTYTWQSSRGLEEGDDGDVLVDDGSVQEYARE